MEQKEMTAWHAWLVRLYTRRMCKYRILAEYNLSRHDEAVNMYIKKKDYRQINKSENGFYIASENADEYRSDYNETWKKYLEYKHKLDAIYAFYEDPVIVSNEK